MLEYGDCSLPLAERAVINSYAAEMPHSGGGGHHQDGAAVEPQGRNELKVV